MSLDNFATDNQIILSDLPEGFSYALDADTVFDTAEERDTWSSKEDVSQRIATNLEDTTQLLQKRSHAELEQLAEDRDIRIYSSDYLTNLSMRHPDIFLTSNGVTFQELINWSTRGFNTAEKNNMLLLLKSLDDPAINTYISVMANPFQDGGISSLSRGRKHIEQIVDEAGLPIYNASHWGVVMRRSGFFAEMPRWTIEEAIDFCMDSPYDPRSQPKKDTLLSAIERMNHYSIIRYLSKKQEEREATYLTRPRSTIEIEQFTNSQGKPIYKRGTFSTETIHKHKDVFSTGNRWTMAQLIDYCTSGKPSKNKRQMLEAIAADGNPHAIDYIGKTTDVKRLLQATVEDRQKLILDIVERHRTNLYRVIRKYVTDPEEAWDTYQDASIRAYQAIDRYRGDAQPYTWLFRIFTNTAKNQVGYEISRKKGAHVEYDEDMFPQSHYDTPEEEVMAHQQMHIVSDAIDSLRPDLKRAFELKELEGKIYETIAAEVDVPIGTVRSRIFRSRNQVSDLTGYNFHEIGRRVHFRI